MALNFPNSPALNDVYIDTTSGFSYQWNGTVWISFSAASSSQIKVLDDISGSFTGIAFTFALTSSSTSISPPNAQSLIINLGGVIQDASDDYIVSGSNIIFSTAPSSALSFSGVSLGPAIPVNTIPDGTVTGGSFTVAGILSTTNLLVSGISTFVGLATHTGTIFGSNLSLTGVATASSFVGALTGTATTTTNIPNLTGAITSVNTTTSLGSFSSANLATALTDETGSGANVFATSPTLVTPVLGIATATSLNVSGVATATTFVGALTGNATGLSGSPNITVTGVNASGVVTATSFSGSGANLTGISSVSFATTSFGLSGTPNLNVGITTVTQLGINTTTIPTKLYVQGNAASNIVTLTDGATITPDFTLGNNFQVTIAASRTIANPTGVTTGQSGVIFIQEDGTGGYTVGWGTSWDFASSTAPTLITTASALNALPYFARSTTSIVVGSVISGIGTL